LFYFDSVLFGRFSPPVYSLVYFMIFWLLFCLSWCFSCLYVQHLFSCCWCESAL